MKARASRLSAAYRALDHRQRLVAGASATLLLTMLLPWYDKAVVTPGKPVASETIIGLAALSFVEAAIFLVAAGVLALVLARGDGGTFQLPTDDGRVVIAAGVWTCALIFYRVIDHPADVGIQWGMFVAFIVAGLLAYAGQRVHAAARSEAPVREPRPSRRRPADAGEDSTELVTWSDGPTQVVPVAPRPRRRTAPPDAEVVEPEPPDADVVEPDADPTAYLERPPAARRDAAPDAAPRPPDRAVRREDARVTVDDPPDAPLRPGKVPRARDRD